MPGLGSGLGNDFSSMLARVNQADAMDPWGRAFAMRFRPGTPGYVGQESDALRDVEHYLYARDRASMGPMGALQMAVGVPGHAGLKALGLKQGDTGLSELLRGWQGTAEGLFDYWAQSPRRFGRGLR